MPKHSHEWKYGGVKYLLCGKQSVTSKNRVVIYLDWFFCAKCLERTYLVLDRTGNTSETEARYGASPVYEEDERKLLGDFCENDAALGWVPKPRAPR